MEGGAVTVCTPHEYAGPKACPHCELERRTAWSNEQIAKRDNELRQLKAQLSDPESLFAAAARVVELEAEVENLKFRLDMVTADPESLASRLLSKHNALLMASANICTEAEREVITAADALSCKPCKSIENGFDPDGPESVPAPSGMMVFGTNAARTRLCEAVIRMRKARGDDPA
jgi:hypothetical protein